MRKMTGVAKLRGWWAAAAAVLLLSASGCGKEGEGELKALTIPRDRIVSINVVSEMGDITVKPTSGENVKITPRYQVQAQSGGRRGLIEENLSVTTDQTDPSVLTVYSHVNESVTLDPETESARINLEIEAPEAIGSVIVQSRTGNILLDGLRGCEISLVNNEGDITVRDTILSGSNHIINVVGDIDLRLRSIESTDDIRAATDAGNVRLDIPRGSSYTVTIEELSQQGISWHKKDGKTRINLVSKIGKVSFPKR